ncbi:hypothetical protein BBK14_01930 [Parafrankia soli]|uniref:Uncharacterized protein n=1 Tax=Parafrankia soli TaxID=2599596 RepID=A0A1S1RLF0_9ACTN|nr:hypothetical protein [Parafrankia soli]OHV46631.1 hypothetical protein BBK14_01930 [Parafrankia soli]
MNRPAIGRATCPVCERKHSVRLNGQLHAHFTLDNYGRATRTVCAGTAHEVTTRELIRTEDSRHD